MALHFALIELAQARGQRGELAPKFGCCITDNELVECVALFAATLFPEPKPMSLKDLFPE
jgi:hypothetical protein